MHRFVNMSRDRMAYDFEYLMTAMEENWPFFNVSISANNVDVHELADNVRAMLDDPSTVINCPLDFLDLLRIHFFVPIGQLGHLWALPCDEIFFGELQFQRHGIEWEREYEIHRYLTRNLHYHNVFTRLEPLLFYTRLREEGRGIPRTRRYGPAKEFDSLEAGRIAHMRVNRMITQDTFLESRNMWHYELQVYNFVRDIEGYDHLILDFRGNPGGQTRMFLTYILPMLVSRTARLPAYMFYMDGEYAAMSREIFDRRAFFWGTGYLFWDYTTTRPTPVNFAEPLPYLDTQINFVYVYRTSMFTPTRRFNAIRRRYFDGELWLLIDEHTASGAEGITALLKYGYSTTVVGEPTFGILATDFDPTTILISLPNTGIIVRLDIAYYTDPYGRPWNGYGIQPHYHPRPGMDALETVLAMIEEGRSLHKKEA